MSDDGFLYLKEDTPDSKTITDFWTVLIVDDDKFIHQVTQLVLKSLVFENKKIKLLQAYTAEQAKSIFRKEKDIALAFIDVVMETDHAGLELIQWLRETQHNHTTRLILRTGQAGNAPEEHIIRDYDIHDYKEKTELTANKLTTATYSGIRSYRDITTIEQNLINLNKLIQAATESHQSTSSTQFASVSLSQLLQLIHVAAPAIHIVKVASSILANHPQYTLLGCTGQFTEYKNFDSLTDTYQSNVLQAFQTKQDHQQNEQYIYFPASEYTESVIILQTNKALTPFQLNCLQMYTNNMAITYENNSFKSELQNSQAELIYLLADVIEARTHDNPNHGKKVALYSQKLAQLCGCGEKLTRIIYYAAPLHDIGKITIPETILNKPSQLSKAEFETIKSHSNFGANLLKHLPHAIAKTAEKIARHHHENWDGTGYPNQLKEQQIPLEARIVSIADVLEVLAAKTVYRTAWSNDKIKSYLIEQSGKKFDPNLIKLVIAHYNEFINITT